MSGHAQQVHNNFNPLLTWEAASAQPPLRSQSVTHLVCANASVHPRSTSARLAGCHVSGRTSPYAP